MMSGMIVGINKIVGDELMQATTTEGNEKKKYF